ncbi:MAG: hypothetical protein IPG17_30140 [Sandaracinaceae bacterium]|nr:hypothetical protein [Sandaracinaceae bacterium]MBP7683392.1 hypothetical protein [Deltaproteobacteria bacterium]MBK6812403.1 hypothetical protein [Sandaracinaceae bacterium]MBK7156468.1 hypothetical protein [Sandaracinaceae bacterium]MBK7774922.1 hypothetical protein [Sandaracinaceae bacterium]
MNPTPWATVAVVRSRSYLLAFIVVAALTVSTMGAMRWWSARSLAQLTPAGDVRWDGYRIEHVREGSMLSAYGALHCVRVFHGHSLVLDDEYPVYDPMIAGGPVGFFGGLNADDDDELELVLCAEGSVASYLEPDRATGGVASRPGRHASAQVRELCTAVGRSGSFPGSGCFFCCAFPAAVPVLIGLLTAAFRERREEKQRGRTPF